jgi:hypothetical protein
MVDFQSVPKRFILASHPSPPPSSSANYQLDYPPRIPVLHRNVFGKSKSTISFMSKIVVVSWLNPSQSVSLYPTVLDGIKIEHKLVRPTAEYFFVATQDAAEELKDRLEKTIPRVSYTVHGEDNRPVIRSGQPVIRSEPEITILDNPQAPVADD